MDLEGKVIIVTGGSQGIGAEIVKKLAHQKSKVIIWDIQEDKANELANDLNKQGYFCIAEKVDITNEEMIKSNFEKIIEKFNSLYGLVNNAGITKDNLILRMTSEQWHQVIETNLTSIFYCSKYAIKYMLKEKEGSIVNISSVVGIMGNIGQVNYAASKAGVIGFTKALAKEVASHNIRVNAVAPGFIQTPMTDKLPPQIKEKFLQNIPMSRFGTCEEVANAVLFLLSKASSYITGTIINVNGGLLM